VRPAISHTMALYVANNHVLNSLLAHAAVVCFGEAPWVVRLPAIVFGVAGVWAFWLCASEIWTRLPSLVGTLLFGMSYYGVYYSQEARGYSGFLFFALLATALILRLLRRPPRERAPWLECAYALAIGLGMYAMVLQLFVVAGHAVVLIVQRRWRLAGWLAAGCGVAALLYAPMAGSLLSYYRTHPSDTGYPLLSRAFAHVLAPLAAVLVVGGLMTLPFVVRLARRRADAAAVILAPLAFNILMPVLRGQGVYPRTLIFGLGAGYLLLVEALDFLFARRTAFGWSAAAVVGVASMVPLGPYYRLPKQGFREALQYVDTHRMRVDQRIGATLGGKAVRFYDPSVVQIETRQDIAGRTAAGSPPAWIIWTFAEQMQSENPDLFSWLQHETQTRAVFPGVIGDGTVWVSYWTPGIPR